MNTRIARYETRKYDWDALKFQADYDPKFRRAQMRYIGTGGTGVTKDMNTIPSEHFTFSTMVIPAGHEGPPHLHTDVEEVFFLLRGKLKVVIEKDGERFRNHPDRPRPDLGAARRVPRRDQHRRRRRADVRDARREEAADADVPGRTSAGQDQARTTCPRWSAACACCANSAASTHADRAELARRFDLPRSTVFRLLTTLENMGFVERTEGGNDYRLGMAVLRLGFEYLASLELTELGTPLLNRLCDELQHALQPGGARRSLHRLRGQGLTAHALRQLGQRGHAPAGACHGAGPHLLEDLTLPSCARCTPKTPGEFLAEHAQDRERAVRHGAGRPPARLCAGRRLLRIEHLQHRRAGARPQRPHRGGAGRHHPDHIEKAAWTRWCCACASPPTRCRACSTTTRATAKVVPLRTPL
jgi:mannose-6-phosphate isomerase-like protein (cupin superfamily)/DNA-binding MarR family transcriptional regulator